MNKISKSYLIKILAPIFYVAMLSVNFLANSLPINGTTPGEVSDAYPNLFAPAGFTFSIWGLIYLFLGAYTLYQLGLFKKIKPTKEMQVVFDKVGLYFILSSFANLSWIFAWHYDYIGLALVLIVSMLYCLIKVADLLRLKQLRALDYWFLYTPFSLYFGWITVATIANVTVFLVSISWSAFNWSALNWLITILIVGALIGVIRMLYDRNVIYGLVLLWAYFGILSKHISVDGFAGAYPLAISVLVILMTVFFAAILLLSLKPSYLDYFKCCPSKCCHGKCHDGKCCHN